MHLPHPPIRHRHFRPGPEFTLRLIQSAAEFSSLAPQWDQLLEQSATNSIFQTSRYLSIWWKHFGAGGELAIIAAERDGELVGIAPLQIRRGKSGARRHLKHLCFLGSMSPAEGLLFDFIIRRGLERPVMEAFFGASSPLFALHWDVLYLPFPPAESPCTAALRTCPGPLHGKLREIPQEESLIIEFQPTWDDFLATRARKFRSNLRGAIRAMEERVGAKEIRAGRDMSVADMHRQLTAFANARWKEAHREPDASQLSAFESDLFESYARDGLLEFYGWRTDSELIALNCSFAHANLLWGYQMGWNPEFAKFSPGQVAMASVVRHGIERGYRGLNMLLGGSSYKSAWAASAVALCRFEAVRLRSVKGGLFGAMKLAQENLAALRSRQAEQDPGERVA